MTWPYAQRQRRSAAIALDALENYFLIQGREWERFAWLKSRVVAPTSARRNTCVHELRDVVLPFVFRRYLDYNVFEGLRRLHQQIRTHAAQRAAGHPERANDVKLSRGGIREIEFTVQLLQVVRGGQFPELRTRPTLDALTRLSKAGLMQADNADALRDAYEFYGALNTARNTLTTSKRTSCLPMTPICNGWHNHGLSHGRRIFMRPQ